LFVAFFRPRGADLIEIKVPIMASIPQFEPSCVEYADRVRSSFSNQPLMKLFDAQLIRIEPGIIELEVPFQAQLTQHNGYLHGGTVATLADTACGYAAYSLMPNDSDVLTVEFKINFLSPAIGERFVSEGRVLRMGRTIVVAQADVFALLGERKKYIATMIATLICIPNQTDP